MGFFLAKRSAYPAHTLISRIMNKAITKIDSCLMFLWDLNFHCNLWINFDYGNKNEKKYRCSNDDSDSFRISLCRVNAAKPKFFCGKFYCIDVCRDAEWEITGESLWRGYGAKGQSTWLENKECRHCERWYLMGCLLLFDADRPRLDVVGFRLRTYGWLWLDER